MNLHPDVNRMTLCMFMGATGYHSASWRLPDSNPSAGTDPSHFAELARLAESGGFDAVFFADSMALWSDLRERPAGVIEPSVLAAAAIAATRHIGVILTFSTTFNEPYNVARKLTSLDHLSGGRIGWNIVTSATDEAARNFGLDNIPAHGERYRRGSEFVDVCIKLWESWDAGAIIGDRSGWWGDPSKVRPIHHNGEFFSVRGPLDVPPSPQRVPLLVQAGSSPEGKSLAAATADIVFTVQSTFDAATSFRAEVQDLARIAGRLFPTRVLPGIIPVIRDTDDEAHDYLARLDDMLDQSDGVRQLERSLGRPLGSLRLEDRFDADLPAPEEIVGNQTYYRVIKEMADARRYTVRDVVRRMSTSRGHRLVVGSPETVAGAMCEWVDGGAADGYVVMPAAIPSDLETFVDKVVPLLRASGHLRYSPDDRPLASRYRTQAVSR